MTFYRPAQYFLNRFHKKQEVAWLGYKSGLDLVLDWGRRSGKTELVAETLIEDIEDNGKSCMYVTNSQKQARKVLWPKLKQKIINNKNWKPSEAYLEAKHLPTGAVIALRGADIGKDRLRGDAQRIIALDEFAHWKDPSIVPEVLVPMLTDYNGQMLYTSTYRGKNHFWELKQRALREPFRFFTSTCTMFENPFISEAGKKRIVEEYPGGENNLMYRQEVLCEPVVFSGLVFAIPQDTYKKQQWNAERLNRCFHWRGVDLGWKDPTAVCYLAYDPLAKVYQFYADYKKSEALIYRHAEAIKRQFPYAYLASFADNDPQVIAEFVNAGLDCIPARKWTPNFDKTAQLLSFVEMLRNGRLEIAENCTHLLSEMITYEWEQEDNDHCIDAARYVLFNAVVPDAQEEFVDAEEARLRRMMSRTVHGQEFGDAVDF